MPLETETNRRWYFKSAWFSEDKSIAALKEQLGVEKLDVEMLDGPLDQIRFVAKPKPEPVTIQMRLSPKALWVLVVVNILASLSMSSTFIERVFLPAVQYLAH